MYQHILIPIDDSKLSEKAIREGIALARTVKARVTGFTALPAYHMPTESEIRARQIVSPAVHAERSRRKARTILGRLERRAKAEGVACELDYVLDDNVDSAIADAASKHRCDLILMASHGRSGLSALLNGSHTRGVLAKTKVPTLVYR